MNKILINLSLLFLFFSFKCLAQPVGCYFENGPVIDGTPTLSVFSTDYSGKTHIVSWVLRTESGLVHNQFEAQAKCSAIGAFVPEDEEFQALNNCFERAPLFDRCLSPKGFADLLVRIPDMANQWAFWSISSDYVNTYTTAQAPGNFNVGGGCADNEWVNGYTYPIAVRCVIK